MRVFAGLIAGTAGAGIALLALPHPASAAEAIELIGRGVQIYICAPAGNVFAWQLKAPEALLIDRQGQEVGHHFAGPSWQATDGSTVVGEVLTASASPDGSIPWLILRAKSHAGSGAYAAVTHIVRSHTAGGLAPQTGCDAGHPGSEARIEYSATYTLFSG